MNNSHRLIWLILILSLQFTSLTAQTRKPVPPPKTPTPKVTPKEPVPTFDTLLAAGNYVVYSEIRGVGQLVRSQGFNGLVEPYLKLAKPAKEFQTIIRWLNLRAEALMTSRMLCASWPMKTKLPDVVCAVEFASVEEAQKFEPQIKTFLPKVMPTPAPQNATAPEQTKSSDAVTPPKPAEPPPPPPPPYAITQTGSIVVISSSPVDFKALRPKNTKLLAEDQNFRTTRDRFTTEQVFVHFDLKGMIAQREERQREAEKNLEEHRKNIELAGLNKPITPDEQANSNEQNQNDAQDVATYQSSTDAQLTATTQDSATVQATQPPMLFGLAMSLAGGAEKWPEAIGGGISFDDDSYRVRALLISSQDEKPPVIPFLPNVIAGPAITPTAASVLPADSDLFVTLSLDYNAIHDSMVATEAASRAVRTGGQMVVQETSDTNASSPFADYEKLLGVKLKEELIPLLGNEIALTLRGVDQIREELSKEPGKEEKPDAGPPKPKSVTPVLLLAVSIRDKEAVKKIIPRIMESIGIKGAASLARIERQADTELVSYAGLFSYAFIGDFLLVSTEPAAVKFGVDSYLKNETLGSDSRYRNFTRWQPRQVVGQVYMPSKTMDTYGIIVNPFEGLSEEMQQFLTSLGPISEPVTYALTNEGSGPLHELHVPRNVMLAFVAGLSGGSNSQQTSIAINEAMAQSTLRIFASAQEGYKGAAGKGSFGSVDELKKLGLLPKEFPETAGYKYEINFSATTFEVVAVPHEYGKTGRNSFFIDHSSVLRGGDHGGGPATIADKPLQ